MGGVVATAWGAARSLGIKGIYLAKPEFLDSAIGLALGRGFAKDDDALAYLDVFKTMPPLVEHAHHLYRRLNSDDALERGAHDRAPPRLVSAPKTPEPTAAASPPARRAGATTLMHGEHLKIALSGLQFQLIEEEHQLVFDLTPDQMNKLTPVAQGNWSKVPAFRIEELRVREGAGGLAVSGKPYDVREMTIDGTLPNAKKTTQIFVLIRDTDSKKHELVFTRRSRDANVQEQQEVTVPISQVMFEKIWEIGFTPAREESITPYAYHGQTVELKAGKPNEARVAFPAGDEAGYHAFMKTLQQPGSWLTEKPRRGRPPNASRLIPPENPAAAPEAPSGSDRRRRPNTN